MISIKNKAVLDSPLSLSATTIAVPFDTVAYSTNSATAFNSADNSISMQAAGYYNTECTVVITAGSAASEIGLQLMANGTEIAGDVAVVTIPASSTQTVSLSVPVSVAASSGSAAKLSWEITVGASATLENAFATAEGIH